ncbi:MAG: lysylphosphatidylglycerol synthase domain-containing protein [Gemmatimonadota bacterium]
MSSRRVARRAVQLLLFALVLWGIYRVLAPELDRLTLDDLNRWRPATLPLLASFALLVAVYLVHALIWRRMLGDLSIGRPSVHTSLRVYFLSSLGRYIPGKLWQLAGLAVLAQRAGLPPAPAAATAVLGQFGFLTTGLLFLGVVLPEWRTVLDPAAGSAGAASAPSGAALPLALGAAMLVAGSAALWLLVATPIGRGFRHRVLAAVGDAAGSRIAGAFDLADRVRPADAAIWAAAYAASWVVLGAAFTLFVAAFEPTAVTAPRYLSGAVAASYLAGYLFVLAPAGIGVREAAMLVLLQPVLPGAGAALVVSASSRLWFTAAELVPLALLPLFPNRDSNEEEPT